MRSARLWKETGCWAGEGGVEDCCDGRYLHRLQLCVLGLLTAEVHLLQAVTHKSEFYSVYSRKSLDPKLKFGSFG